MITKVLIASAGIATSLVLTAGGAMAQTCVGACGTDTANGVVSNPPGFSSYYYVTTSGGALGAGQIPGIANGTNGSLYTSATFSATANSTLTFEFNYVTSDGSGFPDYAWSALIPSGDPSSPTYLFTAATEPTGDTSPGQGLPANSATLNPPTSAIIPGGPTWTELGSYSGFCYAAGCGYTGWIASTYTIATAGTYQIEFGVTNQNDQLYDSGLAFAGLEENGNPIGTPEPATWVMMAVGFVGLGFAGYRTSRKGVALVA